MTLLRCICLAAVAGLIGGAIVNVALSLLEVRDDVIVIAASATVGAWIGLLVAREWSDER